MSDSSGDSRAPGDGLASFWLTSRLGTKKHIAGRRRQMENSSPTRDPKPRVKSLHASGTQSTFSCPDLPSHLFFSFKNSFTESLWFYLFKNLKKFAFTEHNASQYCAGSCHSSACQPQVYVCPLPREPPNPPQPTPTHPLRLS